MNIPYLILQTAPPEAVETGMWMFQIQNWRENKIEN